MELDDAADWLESLAKEGDAIARGGDAMGTFNQWDVSRWLTKAEAAVSGVFPPSAAVARSWRRATSFDPLSMAEVPIFRGAVAVVEAGAELIRDGRISNLIEGDHKHSCDIGP